MSALLAVEKLDVAYGSIRAVKGLSFHVDQGELVALIGANGAGKTSTLKALAGMISSSGSVNFKGEAIGKLKSHERAARGMALVPEGRGVFPKLTVAENLSMGAYMRSDTEIQSDIERMFALFPRLKERYQQTGGTLSGGEQQMLAIARALMARPAMLLLDEPSMGLAPLVVAKIFEIIQNVARDGMTILLIEQNARLALGAAKRAYVMEGGQIQLEGASDALLHDPKVRAAYLGE
jgi:branched-chain amino acid transport system ATP-binding protein